MSVTRDYPWKDGPPAVIGIERRSRLDGHVQVISLDEAASRLERATKQTRQKCEQLLRMGCTITTAGYEYDLHEPGDPPDRPDRRDY